MSAIVLALCVIFCASLVRATVGFGDALVAMPLLTLLIGVRTATPLMGLIAVVTAVVMLRTTWRGVNFAAAWRLVAATVAGIPFGIALLQLAPERPVKALLGAALIAYGLVSLVRPRLTAALAGGWAYLFGFVAGLLGGAYNANGPPVVVYATLNRWPPHIFRATLQGYFLPTGIMILFAHGLSGLWNRQVFGLFALALPCVLFGIWSGGKLHQRIDAARFERALYGLLIALGLLMLV